jgi:hypothetical protein
VKPLHPGRTYPGFKLSSTETSTPTTRASLKAAGEKARAERRQRAASLGLEDITHTEFGRMYVAMLKKARRPSPHVQQGHAARRGKTAPQRGSRRTASSSASSDDPPGDPEPATGGRCCSECGDDISELRADAKVCRKSKCRNASRNRKKSCEGPSGCPVAVGHCPKCHSDNLKARPVYDGGIGKESHPNTKRIRGILSGKWSAWAGEGLRTRLKGDVAKHTPSATDLLRPDGTDLYREHLTLDQREWLNRVAPDPAYVKRPSFERSSKHMKPASRSGLTFSSGLGSHVSNVPGPRGQDIYTPTTVGQGPTPQAAVWGERLLCLRPNAEYKTIEDRRPDWREVYWGAVERGELTDEGARRKIAVMEAEREQRAEQSPRPPQPEHVRTERIARLKESVIEARALPEPSEGEQARGAIT